MLGWVVCCRSDGVILAILFCEDNAARDTHDDLSKASIFQHKSITSFITGTCPYLGAQAVTKDAVRLILS